MGMKDASRPAGQFPLAELERLLSHCLATGYEGVRSGRVRNLPDARTIRWYQTLGIVDRPVAFRGRVALYGKRHLLQLAAVKKLQAVGHPLAEIQRSLAGRTDGELARAAGLTLKDVEQLIAEGGTGRDRHVAPDLVRSFGVVEAAPSRDRTAFWKHVPATVRPGQAEDSAGQPEAALQTAPLGAGITLLWYGRSLTPVEEQELAKRSLELIAFMTPRVAHESRTGDVPQSPRSDSSSQKGVPQ